MTLSPGQHALWPTPPGLHRHPQADALNPLLVQVFGALCDVQRARDRAPTRAFFASDDDLVARIRLPEWQGFLRFLVESLRDSVKAANEGFWPASGLDARGTDRRHGFAAA